MYILGNYFSIQITNIIGNQLAFFFNKEYFAKGDFKNISK